MANFPVSIDSLNDVAATEVLGTAGSGTGLASVINELNDAVEKLEAKVGVDNSAVSSSIDYFLKNASGAFRAEHAQNGIHDATKVAMLAGAQTFIGAKTFGSGLLKATRPQITTSIDDANGNEIIETPATASAVNNIKVTNAATGVAPTVEASGDDTNINIFIKGKGTGSVKLGAAGLNFPNSDGASGEFLKTDGSGNLSFGIPGITHYAATWTTFSTTSTSYVDVTGASVTFNLSATSNLLIICTARWNSPNVNDTSLMGRLLLDDANTQINEGRVWRDVAGEPHPVTLMSYQASVGSGSHTVKLQAATTNASSACTANYGSLVVLVL